MINNKPTILAIDDDPEVLVFYEAALKEKGFNVFTADNGKDALEICEKEKIDLVVLDIKMPDLGGAEVQRCIKEKGKKIKIIISTALRDDAAMAVKCMKMGAVDYIFKPVDHNYLCSVVESHFHMIDYSNETHKIIKSGDGEICMNITYRQVTVFGETKYLTPKEFDLLYLFMKNKNKRFYKADLINKLYGSKDHTYYETAFNKLLGRLRKKLGPIASKRIQNIPGVGYIFRD